VAPAATDGFWVNVAPGGTTGTGLSPLYAAKDFVSTLRSNAMALDAADLSLQTELQAVSNDLKTRMVPVVDSNLDTLNLAWLAVQFWNDVVKNPNVPFVSNKTFYDNSNPYWQPVIGSCEFYMDTNYAVFASSKDEAKYIACRTEASQMNFNYIYPTDVDGQMKDCTAVGELCGTSWTTRVRLNPDQTDADKFTLYTQTRESKELALAFGYSFWDYIQGKTISGLSSCPSGQSCYVSVLAKTFSNTNFGAAFPGNASTLTATRDTNNQINSVSLTGELSPGFNMTRNPVSGYDPVTMQWFYKPNQVVIVLGDKHNVALSAALSQVNGTDKIDLTGTIALIKNGLPETNIELGTGSYILARPSSLGYVGAPVSYTAQNGSQEMLLKLKGGSATSNFTGDIKVGAFRGINA